MSREDIWFAIPSANPALCRKTLPKWREMGYRVAVLQNWRRGEIPADRVVWADEYPGWAESINILCREVVPKDAPIVVSGGDDMLPDPNHTAQELAEHFYECFTDGFGVMQPHGDEYRFATHYCGSPWLGRRFIDTMYRGTGPMFGQYRHNWADVELYWVARCLGALWERPDLTQFHAHFTRQGEEKPDYWTKNVEKTDRIGVKMYIARSWRHFPGHEPIGVDRQFDPTPMDNDPAPLAEQHLAHLYTEDFLRMFGWDPMTRGGELQIGRALQWAQSHGHRRVGLYGAGAFTRGAAGALMRPPVEIICIIDDDPSQQDGSLWNYPIVSKEQSLEMDLDAVILSSDTIEDALWEASSPLREAGVDVLRQSQAPRAAHTDALHRPMAA